MIKLKAKREDIKVRGWKRTLAVILGAGMLASLAAGSALAAETRKKISSVSLTIDASGIQAGQSGGSIEVEWPDTAHYFVSGYEFDDDTEDWKAGDKPKIVITLDAESDYYFSSTSVKVKGDATYSKKETDNDKETLLVTIQLKALEGNYELEEANWLEEASPVASWEDEENVDNYQVRLRRNGSTVGSSVTTTARSYDFGSSITRTGDYTFEVRSYRSTSKHGEWYESDVLTVDEALLNRIQAGNYRRPAVNTNPGTPASGSATFSSYWKQDASGVWKVYDRSGNLVTNCWLCDDAVASNGKNVWYLLDYNGNMVSAGLVRDGQGNYYSLETQHNGFYGMMRYQSGVYGAVNLNLEASHNGRFGAINNQEAIQVLEAMYGTTDISGISSRCVYTSQF